METALSSVIIMPLLELPPPQLLNFVNTNITLEQVMDAATQKDTSSVNKEQYAAYLRQELTQLLSIT